MDWPLPRSSDKKKEWNRKQLNSRPETENNGGNYAGKMKLNSKPSGTPNGRKTQDWVSK